MASSQGASQLFQVLYLGSTRVDRHCSHTIMPWIAEELKLRTEQKIFTWLNPGLWQIEGWEEGGRGGERGERERGSRKSFTVCIIVRLLTTASLRAALQQWFWFSADDWWWLHCAVGYIQANSAHECVFLFTRVHSSSKYISTHCLIQ